MGALVLRICDSCGRDTYALLCRYCGVHGRQPIVVRERCERNNKNPRFVTFGEAFLEDDYSDNSDADSVCDDGG